MLARPLGPARAVFLAPCFHNPDLAVSGELTAELVGIEKPYREVRDSAETVPAEKIGLTALPIQG